MVAVAALAVVILLTSGITAPQARAQGPGNAILIEDPGRGKDLPNSRPFLVSRIFAQGEMPACAQASIDGAAVETQCNVKGRWRDGSLKHAILVFWADLPAKGHIQVDFIPADCTEDGPGLGREEVLNYLDGKWGGVIEAKANTGQAEGATALANVRTMLEQWDGRASDEGVRYWVRGRLATQLIVEDRSAATKHDFGWATDWPMVRTGADVTATAQTIKVQAATVNLLSKWTFPMTAYLEAERIKLCGLNGDTLTVCSGGRGADGTKAAAHLSNRSIGADAGWVAARETRERSLHPIFVVTIFPGWNGVKVDAILENMWSTRLQDQVYSARVGRGADGGDTLWTKDLIHVAQTRWRKTFWNGMELPDTRVDHNLPYLAYTGAIPNYDAELKIAPAAIKAEQDAYSRSDRGDVNGFGVWTAAMPTAGGRGDIALVPRWYMLYLYSGDHTLQKAMYANADVSAYVPVHVREGLEEPRPYVAGREATATGRPLSIDARPTVYARDYTFKEGVRPADRITPVGPMSLGGWYPDMAHHPSMVYLPYLLSGDWYYLEELQFWASYSLTWVAPGSCNWCRGDSLGYIYGSSEPRAEAWSLRTLAEAAFASEDLTPEKSYFESKLQNNIAAREGKLDVHNGTYYDPRPECKFPCAASAWRYGRDYPGLNIPNPLHFAELGAFGSLQDPVINYGVTKSEGSPWQHHYLHVAVGHIRDLGYVEIEPQRRALAENLIAQILSPDYNPYMAAAYRLPLISKETGNFFTTWADTLNGFQEPYKSSREFPAERLNIPYGYPYVLLAALSYAADVRHPDGYSGMDAYEWDRGKVNYELLTTDPSWAIKPRRITAEAAQMGKVIQPSWYRKKERVKPAVVKARLE